MVALGTAQMQHILNSGGGLWFDASRMSAAQVRTLAASAASGGATLIVSHCEHFNADQLQQIGLAGKGRVIFFVTHAGV